MATAFVEAAQSYLGIKRKRRAYSVRLAVIGYLHDSWSVYGMRYIFQRG